MKLYFFGTSHGVPAPDRFCSCYVLEVGQKLYIFDAGAPVAKLLLELGKDMKDIKGLFLTHFHGDHMDGGVSLLTLCDWYYKDAAFEAWLPDAVTENAIRVYSEACDDVTYADGRVALKVIGPGCIFDDGLVRVTAIPVGHIVRPDKRSYAFLVDAEGKRLLYTGDLSYGLKKADFPQVALEERMDLILCEGAHFPVEALEPYMKKVDTEYFAVTHIFPVEEKVAQLRAVEEKYPFHLLIPKDGDVLEL